MSDVKYFGNGKLNRLLVTTGLAVTLAAAPAGLAMNDGALDIATQGAMAMGNGGGGGSDHGGGNGGDGGSYDGGGKGNGGGHGNDGGSANGNANAAENGKSAGEDNALRGGRAKAQERYMAVLDGDQRGKARGGDRDVGRAEYQLSNAEADALLGQGWGAHRNELDDGFRNHGARVSFYHEMARAMDLPAYYGAMWANFGTATENGLAELAAAAKGGFDSEFLIEAETVLAEAIAAEERAAGAMEALGQSIVDTQAVLGNPDATVAEKAAAQKEFDTAQSDAEAAEALTAAAQAELDEAVAAVKPGGGPGAGWETVNLDADGDGDVDEDDLALLQDGDTGG